LKLLQVSPFFVFEEGFENAFFLGSFLFLSSRNTIKEKAASAGIAVSETSSYYKKQTGVQKKL
jgi:hypothetical protein